MIQELGMPSLELLLMLMLLAGPFPLSLAEIGDWYLECEEVGDGVYPMQESILAGLKRVS